MSSKRKTRRRAYLVTLNNLKKDFFNLEHKLTQARNDVWKAKGEALNAQADAVFYILEKFNDENRKKYIQHVLTSLNRDLEEAFLKQCLSEVEICTKALKHHIASKIVNNSTYHMNSSLSKDSCFVFNITSNPISVNILHDFSKHF